MHRSLITRALHAVLALVIVNQLAVSLFMERPVTGGLPENLAFEFHEVVGLTSVFVLGLFWGWTMLRREEHGLATMVPWFSTSRRRALLADVRDHLHSLRRLRLPIPGSETPLANAVHGLGLMIASAMALTGAGIFVATDVSGSIIGVGETLLEVHSTLATVMWAYLIGHAVVAIAHEITGHRVLERILFIRRRSARKT
ncbi:MAG: cytochrome b/b6 domain-containing protein [Gammaproteobacteria bacterium]